MHHEDIKAALRKKGSSLAKIADQLNVTPSAVCHSLHRPCSRRIEAAIAKAIGKTPAAIWPERYRARVHAAAAKSAAA